MQPELRIELLGRFRVAAGERAVDEAAWRLRKARSVVKLLALAPGHRVHRERAIDALWPDREPAAAANNLRQALFVARRALDSCGVDGARRLALRDDMLALEGPRRVDVDVFAAAAAGAVGSDDIALHRAAIECGAGELLPEDRFEPWAAAAREALRDQRLTLLVALAGLHEAAGDPASAIAALQQALLDEPLHEPAHRGLMRLYAATGRRQRALAQYQRLRESLRREFADEADAETRRLYRDILTRRVGEDEAPDRPPSVSARVAGNLPVQLTSFVGRERELADLGALLARTRLLTLTGPGGCGKTRLALEAAARARSAFEGGMWLAELAGLSDGSLVAGAVAHAVGAESRSDRASEAALAAHLAGRRALLVLDNCEHVLGACERLAGRLLVRTPTLVVLATSREPLRVPGEVVWRVPSLSLGGADSEAVRLFAERAAAASGRFTLSAANEDAVAEVCRRLDGLPLAIELAAARSSVLAPAQIAERLHDSLAVLAAGSPTGLTRQQTLGATIDWSHDLLDGPERTLFRRLGVFAGSASLEAIEDVCDGDLGTLGLLVDKSLVVVEEDAGAARYRLLDTVAHYARERLTEAGETAALAARHRGHFAGLAEAGGRLEPAVDDLRAALDGAEPATALRMAAALWAFWGARGDRLEGVRRLEAALAAAPAPSPLRGRALLGLSALAIRDQQPRALSAGEDAVAVFRQIGDEPGTAEALHQLACVHWMGSRPGDAERCCDESRALAERIGAHPLAAAVSHTLGVVSGWRGEPDAAERLDAAVARLRALPAGGEPLLLPIAIGGVRETPGDGRAPRVLVEETFLAARRVRPAQAVAHALADRAAVARSAGDAAAGRAALEESLAIFRRLGDDAGSARVLGQLGNLLSVAGEHDGARELHEESLALREAAHDARGIGLCLSDLGLAAARAGDPERAAAALGRARERFVRTDDLPGIAAVVAHLGYIAVDAGDARAAREWLEQALRFYTGVVYDEIFAGWVLVNLAALDGSRLRAREAIRRFEKAGERAGRAYAEQWLGMQTAV